MARTATSGAVREVDEELEDELEPEPGQTPQETPPPRASWSFAGTSVGVAGYVQTDAVLVDQASQDELNPSTGEPLNNQRFLLRRAGLRTMVDHGFVGGVFEFDVNTVKAPAFHVVEAQLSAGWPNLEASGDAWAQATLGITLIPFGFENQQVFTQRYFLEQSNVVRALFPGSYDLGFKVSTGWDVLRLSIAVMNGDPTREATFPGRDPNAAKDVVGRIGIDTPIGDALQLQAGVSALEGTGFHAGTPSTKDILVWRDANGDGIVQLTEIQVIPGVPGTPSQNFHRFALGADLRLFALVPWLGALELYGELIWATNLDRGLVPADPVGSGRDLRELGWYVALIDFFPWGGLIGARYDRYNPDADASTLVGASRVPNDASFGTLALLLGWRRPEQQLRVFLEYDKNTNALARDMSGLPATLGSDVLTVRGELRF
jgi:hypothetical protein